MRSVDTSGEPILVAVGTHNASKLQRPEVPSASVPRERLVAELDAATACAVTAVSAGPGWGKTQLVASWAASVAPDRSVAWLTLDAEDNEPRVFWTHLVAALRAGGTVPSRNALATVDPRPGMTLDVQHQIAAGVAALPEPVVLVLDDAHEITNPDIALQVADALRPQPPLRLVVTSRTEPFLPVHRLRVDGDLAEIGVERLAFDAAEAAELFARHGHLLDDHDVGLLLERTQGWAAGLRLAALFLTRHGPDARPDEFRGSDRTVADYLLREVLDDQPQRMQRFLLRTSVAGRLCADLADALTGEGHGRTYLEHLERQNTFVTALGPSRTWFRYHPLLADMLRHRVASLEPDFVPVLHERAARWFVAHGEPMPAMRHAAASGRWPLVGRVFTAAAAARLASADRAALHKVLGRIPTSAEASTPDLQLCAAGRLFVEERYAEMQPYLSAARSMLAPGNRGDGETARAVLELFESILARARGEPTAAVAAATNVIRQLDQMQSGVPAAQEYRAVALGNQGVGLFWEGKLAAAEQCFLSAAKVTEELGLELTQLNVVSHLGLLAAIVGRLRDATHRAQSAVSLAEGRGWANLPQAAPAYLALALVAVERHDLGGAERELHRTVTAHAQPEPLMRLAQRLVQASVHLSRGHGWAARRVTEEVRAAWADRAQPALLVHWLQACELEAKLVSGDFDSVRSELLRAGRRATLSDRETLYLARAHLAAGEATEARRLLEPIREPGLDGRLVVEARLLSAMAADRLRQDRRAVDGVRQAMTIAQEEGLVRPFRVIDAPRLRQLVEEVIGLNPQLLRFGQSLLPEDAANGSGGDGGLTEPLTERELTVVHYLGGSLSNAEIAERMFVSQNTVKVHLKHTYRKLGVNNRRAAVQRARELGLTDWRVD